MTGGFAHLSEGLLGGVTVSGGHGEGVRDLSWSGLYHSTQPRARAVRPRHTAGPDRSTLANALMPLTSRGLAVSLTAS